MRKSTKRELLVLLALALLAVTFGVFLRDHYTAKGADKGEQQQAIKRNIMADYDFSAKDLNGNDIVLSEFKGKRVYINFWSLSCRPCEKEMADIEALYNETKDSDIVILSVNVAGEEEKVRSAVLKRGCSFPIILDYEGKITAQYHVMGFPTSFFIDKEGYLSDISIGALTLEEMKKRIDSMD
ncbi:MAG: TlpA disulfide reductase family protein [Pseudomonadota bacterium]